LQHGKECNYSPRVERTPLTRQNLTAAEDRIAKLEAAFADLLPNLDLDLALASLEDGSPQSYDQSQGAAGPASVEAEPSSPTKRNVRESASPVPEEKLPLQADGFDWFERETLSELSDGMGALSIQPEGTGYLGEQLGLIQNLGNY
jgi:transcriptional regulatory protein GAL4